VSYYNMVVEGLDLLYERAFAGDLEYVDRLKRVAALTVELAGAPETDLISAAQATVNLAKQEAEAKACFEDIMENISIVTKAAEGGNDEAKKILTEFADLLVKSEVESPFRSAKHRVPRHPA
jgi:hypothetical protein